MNGKAYAERILRDVIADRRAGTDARGEMMERILYYVSDMPSPLKEETFVGLVLEALDESFERDVLSSAA